MAGKAKMVAVVVTFILVGIASFVLLAKYYPILNRALFGGEFEIPYNDVQFWIKEVPQRNYYQVCAKYLKDTDKGNLMQWGGHTLFFADEERILGIDDIFFTPVDNRIYGGGWAEGEEREWEFFYLGEGKIEGGVFKPIFPQGTMFSFMTGGSIVITDAPAYYITMRLPGTLKKVAKKGLEKGALVEIIEDYEKRYNIKIKE